VSNLHWSVPVALVKQSLKCTLNFIYFSHCINMHSIMDSRMRYMLISHLT
jgi:hypothetical protein